MFKKVLIKMKWLDDNNKLRRAEIVIDIVGTVLLTAIAYALYMTET